MCRAVMFFADATGALPRTPGFSALGFREAEIRQRKQAVPKHCLPEICHGAHVAPQRCIILHDSKGTRMVD